MKLILVNIKAITDELFAAYLEKETFELYASARTGPGKFEGNAHQDLAERLYECSLEGWCDDQRGTVEEAIGWNGLLGRFILTEDDRGFVTYEEFETPAKAEAVFRNIG